MRYLFECTKCKTQFSEDHKMVDRPDQVPCEKCGEQADRILTATPHIGEKVKGYAGGSNKGLKGH